MSELSELKSRMEEAHYQKCEGDFSLDQIYRQYLFEYVEELLRTKNIEEIEGMIVRLEEEAAKMREEIESYWGVCDARLSLQELQSDYNEVVAKHIRLLDLLRILK